MLDGDSELLLPQMLEPHEALQGACMDRSKGPPGGGDLPPQVPTGDCSVTARDNSCVLSHEPTVVTKHRRMKKNFKVSITQEIVAECKVKFYGATDTAANRKAIYRFGTRFCEHHGMRTQHIRAVMPTVVELVLTPDKWELEARNIASTRFIQTRRGAKLSLWHRFLNWVDGVDVSTLEIEC